MAVDFEKLMHAYTWKPIRNCPGRYVLEDGTGLSFSDVLGADGAGQVTEFSATPAPDPVCVYPLVDGGGLISYRRVDGSYVHTLNTPEGFERKLRELGIG